MYQRSPCVQKAVCLCPTLVLVIKYLNTMNEGASTLVAAQRQSAKTKIVLADDHPLLRKALRDLLEKEADFEIVGEAGDGEEAVKLATETLPDVVIMDISMPNLDGLQATQANQSQMPERGGAGTHRPYRRRVHT